MPQVTIVSGTLAQIEAALFGAIAAAREGDALAPVTVAVDNVLLKQQLPRSFAQRGLAQLNVRYLTLDELAVSLAQAAGSRRERLTRDAERLLVREVAATAGGYFAPVAGRDGFADALGRLFRDLELGALAPDDLLSGGGHEEKHRELRRLYAAYLERRGGFAGRAEHYADAAAAHLEGPLFVYGVWAPAEVQARFIERMTAAHAVTVFLPRSAPDAGEAQEAAHEAAHGAAQEAAHDAAHGAFRGRLIAAGAAETRVAPVAGEAAAAEVAARLFRASSGAIDAPVELVSAPDTVREVWEAARWCLERARGGVHFHEMAVVYRNRDPYRELVDEIFSEAGIETYLHDGRLLSEHPLGRRVIALLELASAHEEFERVKVMEFLTETQLPRETTRRYSRVRPSEWEAYTREAGVVQGLAQWQERLERLAREQEDKSQDDRFTWLRDAAERVRELMAFAAEFHEALAARPDEATWEEHLAYLRSLASRYADGVTEILDALEDLKALASVRERVPFDVFARAVRDDLEWRDTTNVLKEPVRQFGRRGVAVLDASSLRHLRFRAVYLLGVAERAWPPPPRPDPLLLEHERRAINDAADGALPLRTEPDRETLTFHTAIQAATERLAMSYARADAGRTGKHLPSYYFRSVADALEGRRISIDELEWSARVRRIEAGRLAPPDLARSLSPAEYDRGMIRATTETGSSGAAIEALAAERPAFASAVRARRERWTARLTPYDGVMAGADAIAAARARSPFVRGEPVSASRLEMYGECPYRYLLRYGLGIEPVEEPEAIERIDHLQRGSLIHEILQRFMTAIGRSDPPAGARRAEHLRLLMQVARECGEERVRRGVTGRPLIWEKDRREIEEDLVRWYDKEAQAIAGNPGLLPGAHEARFGKMPYTGDGEDAELSTDEPLLLTVEERKMLVYGRIDRIDWDDARTEYRVIDYKTGKFTHDKDSMLEHGEALQLPLYLLAASQMLRIDAARGEAQYFHATSRGSFKRHTLPGEGLEARREDFERVMTTIHDGINSGFFAPNATDKHCRWCDYRDVCDARIDRLTQRKRGDARGAEYFSLEEIS